MKKDEGNKFTTPEQNKESKCTLSPRKNRNVVDESSQIQLERFRHARRSSFVKYSEISRNRFKKDENTSLKYIVRPGNGSKLIKRVLEQSGRTKSIQDPENEDKNIFPGWEPADDELGILFNFKWKSTSGGIKYDIISKHGFK